MLKMVLRTVAIVAVLPTASLAVPKHAVQNLLLTPGVADPEATVAKVCTPNYTSGVRHVTASMKRQVFASYGVTKSFGTYEVDHLISLEIGGANDVKNLWPQRYCPLATARKTCFGAREKDVAENYLHREVCAGRMTLAQAQAAIVQDWFAVYLRCKEQAK